MQTLIVTKTDTGKSFEVQVDTVVEVRLPENPTTGFRWKAYDVDEAHLRQQEARFESGGPAVGEGGTRIFQFRAVAPGRAVLRLKLFREWEGDASILDRFEVTLSLKK